MYFLSTSNLNKYQNSNFFGIQREPTKKEEARQDLLVAEYQMEDSCIRTNGWDKKNDYGWRLTRRLCCVHWKEHGCPFAASIKFDIGSDGRMGTEMRVTTDHIHKPVLPYMKDGKTKEVHPCSNCYIRSCYLKATLHLLLPIQLSTR